MGTLFSTLSIGRSGLAVAQIQLDTAGHNIANAANADFSRQRVELLAYDPNNLIFGKIGRGVRVGLITRLRDSFLDASFRDQVHMLGSANVRAEFFSQVEDVFMEPGPNGFSARMSLFFDALNEFATNVESVPIRQSVINEAEALAQNLTETYRQLDLVRTGANQQVINQVPAINGLGSQIADLNLRISRSELGGAPANDLRDQRDAVLDDLAELVDIFARERADGTVDVLISGQQFVFGRLYRELETVANPALDAVRNDFVDIRFVDTGEILTVSGGEVFGALNIRDTSVSEVIDRLNTIASTLIQQVNAIQTVGNGLNNFSGTLTSASSVDLATDPLITATGLDFPITTGSFDFTVYDAAGNVVSTTPVAIGAGTTLNALAAGINGIPNITSVVNADNTIGITAAAGFTFAFSNDSTGALAALGLNTLFTGADASNIGVNSVLVADPSLLASGYDLDLLVTGDNLAALDLANVQNGQYLDSGTSTILDFYETTIVGVGVDARSNLNQLTVEEQLVDTFNRRRQAVSGVSIDEEVTFLLQFERAFQASARVITTTDRMLGTLLSMAL